MPEHESKPSEVPKSFVEIAFPQIESIELTVKQEGHVARDKNEYIYNKHTITEYLSCSNPRCSDGGFSMREIVRKMVSKK